LADRLMCSHWREGCHAEHVHPMSHANWRQMCPPWVYPFPLGGHHLHMTGESYDNEEHVHACATGLLQITKERARDTSVTMVTKLLGCYPSVEDTFSKCDTGSLMTKRLRTLNQGTEQLTCISWRWVLQLQFSFPNGKGRLWLQKGVV